MFGVRYIRATPTTHVIHFRNGGARREGLGLAFWYYEPSSTVVFVPVSSVDVPFVFTETTSDFQEITIEGQMSYRVIDPKRLASLMDYSVDPHGRYQSEDPQKLSERLVSLSRVYAGATTHRTTLREALLAHATLASEMLSALKTSELVASHGLEVLSLSVLSIKPTPDTAKALEAEAREQLMRQADEAIYARRNSAVAQERTIRENELSTEVAVEEKRRQIRESQMRAEIAVEQQRSELLAQRLDNDRKDAEAKAFALNAMLTPLRDVDWRTLTALSAGRMDAKSSIAMAFRDIAENAEKIGSLHITPELLASLVSDDARPAPSHAPSRGK